MTQSKAFFSRNFCTMRYNEWAKLTNKFASLNLTSANHLSVSILQQTGTLFRFKDCLRKEVQTWRRWRKNKDRLLTKANLAAKEGVKKIILSLIFCSCSNSPISDLIEWFLISASSGLSFCPLWQLIRRMRRHDKDFGNDLGIHWPNIITRAWRIMFFRSARTSCTCARLNFFSSFYPVTPGHPCHPGDPLPVTPVVIVVDHSNRPAFCKWSSRGVGLLQMMIRRNKPLASNHPEGPASCK